MVVPSSEHNGREVEYRQAGVDRVMLSISHNCCWGRNKCNQLCARGTLVDKLYYLDMESSDHANTTVAKSDSLWHSQLAHVPEAAIKRMRHEGLVNGAKLFETKVGLCEPCLKGKRSCLPFKVRSSQLEYLNLYTPMYADL